MRTIILTYLIGLCFVLEAQVKINRPYQNFFTDNLGNVYLINDYSLAKFNANGELLYNYDNRDYGRISSVDISEAYKLLVFYQSYSTAVFLDNTLSINSSIVDLQNTKFNFATLCAQAYNNAIWLFDPLLQRVVRLDENLNKTHDTQQINKLIGEQIDPELLIENNNSVFLYDPKIGILQFDLYGTYIKRIPITHASSLQFDQNSIGFYNKETRQYGRYDLIKMDTQIKQISDSTITKIEQADGKFYIGKSNRVEIAKSID